MSTTSCPRYHRLFSSCICYSSYFCLKCISYCFKIYSNISWCFTINSNTTSNVIGWIVFPDFYGSESDGFCRSTYINDYFFGGYKLISSYTFTTSNLSQFLYEEVMYMGLLLFLYYVNGYIQYKFGELLGNQLPSNT